MPLTNAQRRRRYYVKWRSKHLRWAKENPKKAEAYKRRHQLKHEYGLTLEQYDQMFAAQGGVCAICHQPETHRGNKYLSVDHCHTTGNIRGLLCHACNCVVGYGKDDPTRLRSAADYLERSVA